MHSLFDTLKEATLSFLFESKETTSSGPHIRDAIDLKRIMILVVIALIPCTVAAIWNCGVQSYVYGTFNPELLEEYFTASTSFLHYCQFGKTHFSSIIIEGIKIVLPIICISYLVGGFWEIVFAAVRGKEVSEGFLVSGLLYALILPSTLPYWMIAVGVSLESSSEKNSTVALV